MDNLVDWFYGQIVGFLGNFFAQMGNMGVELFDLAWVQAIVLFFSRLAWALFGVRISGGLSFHDRSRQALCAFRLVAGNLFRGHYRLWYEHR